MERRRRRQRHARADGFGRGGAATAWAAAALSARARRLPAQLERGQVQGSVAARGNAAAVTAAAAAAARAGGRVRTGRSSDRLGGRCSVCHEHAVCAARARSGAGKRGGVRSATVGVGGRPSCGEEGGRQVRVARVALHRPVERHSSRDRAWAAKSRWGRGRWEIGRDSFRAFKSGFARSATLGLPRKAVRLERGLLGRPNSHLAGLLMFS